jgi:hypothetical protein
MTQTAAGEIKPFTAVQLTPAVLSVSTTFNNKYRPTVIKFQPSHRMVTVAHWLPAMANTSGCRSVVAGSNPSGTKLFALFILLLLLFCSN